VCGSFLNPVLHPNIQPQTPSIQTIRTQTHHNPEHATEGGSQSKWFNLFSREPSTSVHGGHAYQSGGSAGGGGGGGPLGATASIALSGGRWLRNVLSRGSSLAMDGRIVSGDAEAPAAAGGGKGQVDGGRVLRRCGIVLRAAGVGGALLLRLFGVPCRTALFPILSSHMRPSLNNHT